MRCIFCKNDSASSRSVEHIIPESIGSKKRVLPQGIVCDKCNNYFARKIEEPVLSHSWMRNLRAWHQVPNKKGIYPSMLGNIAGTNTQINMRQGKHGELNFDTENKKDAELLQKVISGGFEQPLFFTIEDDSLPKEMSRFLCKMAFETVAEQFLMAKGSIDYLVDEPYFNNIRNYARNGMNFKDWPYHQRRVFPIETLMKHPETKQWVQAGFGCCIFMNGRQETFFAFILYGIEFVLNIGGPSIKGYLEWLNVHDGISPMIERLGCKLVAEKEGTKTVYYLHGSFNSKAGLEFDEAHNYHNFNK